MPRLPDEQWAMIEDSIDKKRTAASAFKQRTHCGRGGRVRFPSDFKSKKELEAMNGEVKSYRLNDPMSWDEFVDLPNDLKAGYIISIREKFDAPDKYIADMLGVAQGLFSMWLKDLKLDLKLENGEWNKETFLAWTTGAKTDLVEENENMTEVATEYYYRPIDWTTFKTMSDKGKIAYIKWIRETFDAPDGSIAEIMGVSGSALRKLMVGLGCGNGKGGKRKWKKDEFATWAKQDKEVLPETAMYEVADVLKAEEPVVEKIEAEENPVSLDIHEDGMLPVVAKEVEDVNTEKTENGVKGSVTKRFAVPHSGNMQFDCPADLALNALAQLLGDRHIKLSVSWEVLPEIN